MMNKLLILRLEGPLQSWGKDSKWDFRDTDDLPTKSGIVGLLGCAMGEERGSNALVELAQSMNFAVRADRAGVRCVDFQTVTGAPLMSAFGKPRSLGNTIITPHAYLQDACFTVFIETTDYWRERIVDALKYPKWSVYLGRKNCVPSRPVLACEDADYPTIVEALEQYPAASRATYPMMYECELHNNTTTSLRRPDELIGPNRQFGLRSVWRGVIKEPAYVFD